MPKRMLGEPVDEHKWNKAKEIAAKEGRAEDWAYIVGIYKKMMGVSKTKKAGVEKSLNKGYTYSRKVKLVVSKGNLQELRCGNCNALLMKGLNLDHALIETKCRRCGKLIVNI